MVKFGRFALENALEPGTHVVMTVTGELTDGTQFEGSDIVTCLQ